MRRLAAFGVALAALGLALLAAGVADEYLRPDRGAPLAPLAVARGGAVLGLSVFGSLHWMHLLEPAAPFRAWEAVGVAVLVMGALLAAAGLESALVRRLAAFGVALAALGLALLAAGVADEYLRPDRWGALLSGIGRGIQALPGARVPFRGFDEWTRSVLAAGGTALVVLSAALAFWPRSRGRTGYRGAALLALITLYVVPTVALVFDLEFLRGALLVVLVIAFLRLERLRRRDARAAGLAAAAVVVLGLLVAPLIDRATPWWDYETWALSAASAKTTSFSWDHDYGPLDWPRDGRELLRVKAHTNAYWKAENLDFFDGRSWRRAPYYIRSPVPQVPDTMADPRSARKWNQRISVTVRNLASPQVVTAGAARDVEYPRSTASTAAGVVIAGGGRPLRRGDAYSADVYTPEPQPEQLRVAGVAYDRWLDQYRLVSLPGMNPFGTDQVRFPAFGSLEGPELISRRFPRTTRPAADQVEASGLRRAWSLALKLSEGANGPYAYVRRVEQYLRQASFTYSESPPASASTLDGFLFDAKQGFCQQYSGAMALLLRMGGVPARVSAGFTTGSYDKKEREYVVRDFDAHSWVEAWFPGYGWVTFDPTPSSAPPRSQTDATDGGAAVPGSVGKLGLSDRASAPHSPVAAGDSQSPWALIVAGALAAALLSLVGLRLRQRLRRRRAPRSNDPAEGPSLAELERALRRSGRGPLPGTTLNGLEAAFSASPRAAAYVRAVREQRYRDAARGPSPAERRGLRAELARGAGLGGRFRAWWALPPRM